MNASYWLPGLLVQLLLLALAFSAGMAFMCMVRTVRDYSERDDLRERLDHRVKRIEQLKDDLDLAVTENAKLLEHLGRQRHNLKRLHRDNLILAKVVEGNRDHEMAKVAAENVSLMRHEQDDPALAAAFEQLGEVGGRDA